MLTGPVLSIEAIRRRVRSRIESAALLFILCGVSANYISAQPSTTPAIAPTILWQPPSPISFLTPLSAVQLNATVLAGPPRTVPLSTYYNVSGITTPGATFVGGFDGTGATYSETFIGSSVLWRGIEFPIGPADAPDAVFGQTIELPQGAFGSLLLLADMVNNKVPSTYQFKIAYTDGSTDLVSQSMSDWVNPRNYAGESIAASYPTRNNPDGSVNPNSVSVYGYELPLKPTKTVQSITLPNDRDVVILSMVLAPPAVPASIAYAPAAGTILPSGSTALHATVTPTNSVQFSPVSASVSLDVIAPPNPVAAQLSWPPPAPVTYKTPLSATQLNASVSTPEYPTIVPLGPYSRVNAIYADGSVFEETGFDGHNIAYSASQLGDALSFAGVTFPHQVLGVPDAVTSTTLPLPSGNYTKLYLVGAGANGPQLNQTFSVTYSDGTRTVNQLDLSSWDNPQSFADEAIVARTDYANTSSGTEKAGTYDVYGYKLTLDPSRTVQSLTLPSNTNVLILAVGLSNDVDYSVPGGYGYTPGAGTVLPIGTNPLQVEFTPNDATDFTSLSGSNTLVVQAPVLTVTANNASRVYGTGNPTFSGSVTGALPGDAFIESFSTQAGLLSSPGAYAITPAASGADLATYQQTIVAGTLTIGKAPVIPQMTSSANAILQQQPVTLAASIRSSTTGVPTGTISFYSNGQLLGTANLVDGAASLATSLSQVGTNQITYSYNGDVNFQATPLVSGPAISVAPLDFLLTAPNGTSMTGVWGQRVTVAVQLAPMHGVYASKVVFSSSGQLPPNSTASFAPNSVGPTEGTTTVTFVIDSRLLSEATPLRSWRSQGVAFACLLIVMPFAGWGRRRSRATLLLMGIIAIGAVTALTGCGSGYKTGVYTLPISATDGTVTHGLTLTLTLNPPR